MIKAKKIQALVITLSDEREALLVQDGPEWNNLQKFRCIKPTCFDDQQIIAAREGNDSFSAMFGSIFQIDGGEKWVVVMASPLMASMLKQEETEPPSSAAA